MLAAAGMVAALLVAGLVAVYVLDVNPWGPRQELPPILSPESVQEASREIGELERRLREAGLSLRAPLADMLAIAEGRELLFAEALEIEKSGDYALAVALHRRLVRHRHGGSAMRLGTIYDHGKPGVPRDYAEALRWYEEARVLGER